LTLFSLKTDGCAIGVALCHQAPHNTGFTHPDAAKTLLLRANSNFFFVRSANIFIYYLVFERSKSRPAHQDRRFLAVPN
jgi:hypothetical protein